MTKKDEQQMDKNQQNASSLCHVVFNEADAAVLNKVIELDEALAGEILIVRDDYAVGPLADIFETEGYQARREWWKNLLDNSPYNTDQLMNLVDDRLMMHQLRKELEANNDLEVWIWAGQNQHDVCGYYWLVGQLKQFAGRIFILYFNNLPFINEKGQIFYPTHLDQIQPKEFLKAKKLNRKITPSEFEVDPDEWLRLSKENAMVRILEGGKKIVSKDEDFYDKDILSALSTEPQKGNKVIHNILTKMKIKTGDVFILGRIRKLSDEGKLALAGDVTKGWKDFEVKLPSQAAEEIQSTSE